MSRLVGSTLPHLSDQIIWKVQRGAVSHPQSHSTRMAIPNKSPVSPRLPVAPPKGLLVPADLLSQLPGLRILVSPEEKGHAAQELPPPSSTAKNILDSTLPALHTPTSPHSSRSPRNTHTHMHTRTTAPFPHCPPFPTRPSLGSTNFLAPRAERNPQDHLARLSSLRIATWMPSTRPLPRLLHLLLADLQGQGAHYLPRQASLWTALTLASAQYTQEVSVLLWFCPRHATRSLLLSQSVKATRGPPRAPSPSG